MLAMSRQSVRRERRSKSIGESGEPRGPSKAKRNPGDNAPNRYRGASLKGLPDIKAVRMQSEERSVSRVKPRKVVRAYRYKIVLCMLQVRRSQ
jgi:hypothetical protein